MLSFFFFICRSTYYFVWQFGNPLRTFNSRVVVTTLERERSVGICIICCGSVRTYNSDDKTAKGVYGRRVPYIGTYLFTAD